MDIQLDKRLMEAKPGSFIFEFNNSISSENCKDIINRFESSESDHYQGRVGQTFEENADVKNIGKCVFNSLWIGRCFGKDALESLKQN